MSAPDDHARRGAQTKKDDAASLDRLYGPDYFSGRTSGYPPEGYGAAHPDWTPWLDLIQEFVSGGVLLDLGCAYGYLVREARARSYRSFGLDISSYALRQLDSVRSQLLRADVAHLPVRDGVASVVCLFDVLEHLFDPTAALREAARVLSPRGLLIGATPDPICFPRRERTHVFERPPSFWLAALRGLGLEVRFRFSEDDFNFQFVAARPGTTAADKLGIFQHDYFSPTPDIGARAGELEAAPRAGWGYLRHDSRRLAASPATLYLLNSKSTPQRCRLRFQVRHDGSFGTLRVRFNSLVLAEIALGAETTVQTAEPPEFLVPAGGHHLNFEIVTPGTGEVFIGPLQAETSAAASSELTETLPFDLYQRYRFAAQAAEALRPDSVLDVGGYLGDEGGHLATAWDFFAEAGLAAGRMATTDIRQGDFPGHTPAPAWSQPFGDGAFDLVISLDVMEHLPPDRRPEFLEELLRVARRWILLGAPCRSPEVLQAEETLAEGLMQTRPFLQEHRQMGLPEASEVTAFFRREGCSVSSFPNGYLPRWTSMQALTQVYFSLRDAELFQNLNRLYNQEVYPFDLCSPAYRTIFLISREPLRDSLRRSLEALLSAGSPPSLERLFLSRPGFLKAQQRALEIQEQRTGAWRDTQFLANERQKLIGLQRREIHALRKELDETPLWRLARRRWKQKRGKA